MLVFKLFVVSLSKLNLCLFRGEDSAFFEAPLCIELSFVILISFLLAFFEAPRCIEFNFCNFDFP